MITLLNRIRKKISEIVVLKGVMDNEYNAIVNNNIVNESTREKESLARAIKSFDEQAQYLNARALVAHEANCDVVNCQKDICFVNEPDKIVAKSIVTSDEVRKDQINRTRMRKRKR